MDGGSVGSISDSSTRKGRAIAQATTGGVGGAGKCKTGTGGADGDGGGARVWGACCRRFAAGSAEPPSARTPKAVTPHKQTVASMVAQREALREDSEGTVPVREAVTSNGSSFTRQAL